MSPDERKLLAITAPAWASAERRAKRYHLYQTDPAYYSTALRPHPNAFGDFDDDRPMTQVYDIMQGIEPLEDLETPEKGEETPMPLQHKRKATVGDDDEAAASPQKKQKTSNRDDLSSTSNSLQNTQKPGSVSPPRQKCKMTDEHPTSSRKTQKMTDGTAQTSTPQPATAAGALIPTSAHSQTLQRSTNGVQTPRSILKPRNTASKFPKNPKKATFSAINSIKTFNKDSPADSQSTQTYRDYGRAGKYTGTMFAATPNPFAPLPTTTEIVIETSLPYEDAKTLSEHFETVKTRFEGAVTYKKAGKASLDPHGFPTYLNITTDPTLHDEPNGINCFGIPDRFYDENNTEFDDPDEDEPEPTPPTPPTLPDYTAEYASLDWPTGNLTDYYRPEIITAVNENWDEDHEEAVLDTWEREFGKFKKAMFSAKMEGQRLQVVY